ncbi:MAG: hypothetical protein H0W02_17985 [Ktedonobacteraceae bacterium]|nr:hypothetical protein [Ktedonobacteraceae bacterium]
MRLSRDEIRARLLTQAETVIDDILAWEAGQSKLSLVEAEDAALPVWHKFGEQTAQLLIDQREEQPVVELEPWDEARPPEVEADAAIEIIDLPQHSQSHTPALLSTLGTFFSPNWRTRRLVIAAGIVLLALLVVVASVPETRSRAACIFLPATPTPSDLQSTGSTQAISSVIVVEGTPAPGELPGVWTTANGTRVFLYGGTLAPAPHNCVAQSRLGTFDAPTFPAGIGKDPLWITGFSGSQAALISPGPHQRIEGYGWAFSITLVVKKGFPGPFFLTGMSQDASTLLWFDNLAPASGKTNTLVLDPNYTSIQPQKSDQQWQAWKVTVYVRSAGCYSLTANWPGGQWDAVFAAGS